MVVQYYDNYLNEEKFMKYEDPGSNVSRIKNIIASITASFNEL